MSCIRFVRLVVFGWLLIGLTGCQFAGSGDMTADEAFALSASALSGSESYGLSGEVSVLDASGIVANRAEYEGEVTEHGKLNVQWKSSNTMAAATDQTSASLYEPLGLMEAIQAKSASIAYRNNGGDADEVHFEIKLNGDVAKRRIADQLRKELSALEEDKTLLARKPDQSASLLAEAKMTLEKAIDSLKVTTNCEWSANRRTWFPTRLQEDTVLEYKWNGKSYSEKRASVTNFRTGSGDGTMDRH